MRNTTSIIGLIALWLSTYLVSCEMRDELLGKKPGEIVNSDEIGVLDLQLEVKIPAFTTKTIEIVTPNEDQFEVKVFDSNMELQNYFESYAVFKEKGPVTLPAGIYTVEAYSGEYFEATIDKPYYEMSEQYEIKKKEVTTVAGICEMKSAIVSFVLSDDFLNSCTDDYAIIITNGTGVLTLSKGDPFVVYIKSGSSISITIKATDKKTQTPVMKTFKLADKDGNVNSQDLFTVTIKELEEEIIPDDPIKPDPTPDPDPMPDPDPDPDPETPSAGGNLTIKVDVTLNEKPIDIIVPSNPDSNTPGDDDNDNNQGGDDNPVGTLAVTGDGIDSPAIFKKGSSGNVVVKIDASNGLSNLNVQIDSPLLPPDELEAIGLKSDFDLANVSGELKTALSGLGFPTGNEVSGQTNVTFDISKFVPMLGVLGTGVSKFHLSVTDAKGNSVSKTITIEITE